MNPNDFGKYLKSLREERSLTIRQVEAYAGVSNSYLSLLENGKRGIPSPDILKKIALIYKISYEDLMVAAGHLTRTKDIGQRLKQARLDKGFSQVQVMEHTNINNKTLSGYENNVSEPDLNTLEVLANLYEVTVDHLLGRKSALLEALERDGDKVILDWFKSLTPDLQDFLKNKDNQVVIGTIHGLQTVGFSNEMIHEWLGFLINHLTPYVQKYGVKGKVTMAVDPADMTEEEKRVIKKLNKKFFTNSE